MKACKARGVALVAFVVGVLGVTVANAHSGYRYSGFDDATCARPSDVGANDVAVLKRAGAVAYIDNLDPAKECVGIADIPSGSHYSGFADAVCSQESYVGQNDIRTLRDAGGRLHQQPKHHRGVHSGAHANRTQLNRRSREARRWS